MKYVFQFGIVWDHLPRLLDGAWLTIRLSLGAFALGFVIAMLLAYLRTSGPRPLRAVIAAYVEFIRNTPFLVQLFIIYFSLPAIGIRFEAITAAFLGLQASTPLLHSSGALWGFALGVVMLKARWVDCENWDLFAVMKGRHGRPERRDTSAVARVTPNGPVMVTT